MNYFLINYFTMNQQKFDIIEHSLILLRNELA